MTLLWEQTSSNSEQSYDGTVLYCGARFMLGQVVVGNYITKVTFSLKKQGSPSGTVHVDIINTAGTFTSTNSVNASDITTSSADYEFTFASIEVDASSYITCRVSSSGTSSNRVQCDFNTSAVTNVEMWVGANYDSVQESNACPKMKVYGTGTAPASGTVLLPPPYSEIVI